MFWICVGVVLGVLGGYYGIKSLYTEYTSRLGNRFTSPLGLWDYVVILLRALSQILILTILVMALMGKTYNLPGLLFIQGAFAVVMAFIESVIMNDHLKSSESTLRKIDGTYDVKLDLKRKTAEISDHYEGHGPIPWQSILAFPFRLIHNFCIPVAVLIFEFKLRKKSLERIRADQKEKSEARRRYEKEMRR